MAWKAAVVTVQCLILCSGAIQITPENVSAHSRTQGHHRHLGDGCYHVFIDAGSNRGVHGRFFFEPEKYNRSSFAQIFSDALGPNRDLQDACVFAFEPNPLHKDDQTAIMEAYGKKGWRYHYIQAGVGAEDGNLKFYPNIKRGRSAGEKKGQVEQVSFSMVDRGYGGDPIEVQVIDLAKWLDEQIFPRSIPRKGTKNYGSPAVMMKMDVEGAEWQILPRLVDHGCICHMTHFYGETHTDRILKGGPVMSNGTAYNDTQDLKNLMAKWNEQLKQSGCPQFKEFDDESYVNDGQPLPQRRSLPHMSWNFHD